MGPGSRIAAWIEVPRPGAQTILNLRILQLSGVWDAAYARVLANFEEAIVWSQQPAAENEAEKAA